MTEQNDIQKALNPELHSKELIYKLEDRPPLPDALFAALQHLLAIFVAIITNYCRCPKA